jgi:hypothetical protein
LLFVFLRWQTQMQMQGGGTGPSSSCCWEQQDCTGLSKVLQVHQIASPIMVFHTDGGPLFQLPFIALYLGYAGSCENGTKPAREQVNCVLNLSLQSVLVWRRGNTVKVKLWPRLLVWKKHLWRPWYIPCSCVLGSFNSNHNIVWRSRARLIWIQLAELDQPILVGVAP